MTKAKKTLKMHTFSKQMRPCQPVFQVAGAQTVAAVAQQERQDCLLVDDFLYSAAALHNQQALGIDV